MMEIRNLVFSVIWAALAPLAGNVPVSGGLLPEPGQVDDAVLALDRTHGRAERLHERWLPDVTVDWQRSRELAVAMFCDLGVIALALTDCGYWVALNETTASDVLPRSPTVEPSTTQPPVPDFEDIHRRSIEERMGSI